MSDAVVGPNDDKMRRRTDEHERQSRESFERDLASLLNRYSRENGSNTPDFILARYLVQCLDAWNENVSRRTAWSRPAA